MAIIIQGKTKLTYEDYALLPEDGKIHEIIDGEHYMTPSPVTYHQMISGRLQFQLYEQIVNKGLGLVLNAPLDVQLSKIDIVQPDLLVVLEERRSIISPSRVIGPPDLVIEILSEWSREKDLRLKLDLYQIAAVPEYWIVDPESQELRKYLLREGNYREIGAYHEAVAYEGLEGVRINLLAVW